MFTCSLSIFAYTCIHSLVICLSVRFDIVVRCPVCVILTALNSLCSDFVFICSVLLLDWTLCSHFLCHSVRLERMFTGLCHSISQDFEFTCPVSLCQIRPCVRTERLTQHVTPDQTSWLRSEHPQSDTRSEAIRHAIEKVEAKDRNILDFINKVCVYLRHQTSFISVLCH